MLFEVFLFSFAFFLGSVSTLAAGVAGIFYYLRFINAQTDKNKDQRGTVTEPQPSQYDHARQQMAGFLRVRGDQPHLVKRSSMLLGQSSASKNQSWSYGVLKGNMLFKFKDNQAQGVAQVTCLDGCTVEATDTNWASKNTAIKLEHPERDLLDEGLHCVWLYFPTGRELEEWYYALRRASSLSQNLHQIKEEDERVHDYFSKHSNSLLNPGPSAQNDNAWCNAVLARFWWNFQDNKSFQRFLRHGLSLRIKKMTDFPGFIDSMVLEHMHIGSSIPMISNATLASMTERGEVDVDMDVVYHTGLEMRINVNTSLQLPGASVKVPASAYMQIKKLSGRMRLHVSPPPCERFWIGFHTEPQFDINAETTIGNESMLPSMMQLTNNLMKKLDITNLIVNKFKANILSETMVLPNMDEWPMPYWPEDEHPVEDESEAQGIVIYTRPVSAESEKSGFWKAGSLIDISPEGISVMGTSVLRAGLGTNTSSSKDKDKEL